MLYILFTGHIRPFDTFDKSRSFVINGLDLGFNSLTSVSTCGCPKLAWRRCNSSKVKWIWMWSFNWNNGCPFTWIMMDKSRIWLCTSWFVKLLIFEPSRTMYWIERGIRSTESTRFSSHSIHMLHNRMMNIFTTPFDWVESMRQVAARFQSI